MVICLPVGETILMGTTEVETQDPADRTVSGSEIDYLLASLRRLFVDLPVERGHVVAVTSGIRPLKSSDGDPTRAARDHSLVEKAHAGRPVLCLVGGKWTTFRSFAEQASDVVLARLGRTRTESTADRRYPGALPVDAAALADKTGLSAERVATLVARYGAIAERVADACAAGIDRPIAGFPDLSRREVEWLAIERMACTLEDLVLRRAGLVLTGRLGRDALGDLATILSETLGHDPAWVARELKTCSSDPRICMGDFSPEAM
jgi:glycerol-3-phosphate dehydrogenase